MNKPANHCGCTHTHTHTVYYLINKKLAITAKVYLLCLKTAYDLENKINNKYVKIEVV